MGKQTEALNNCLEDYLRCYAGLKPKKWVQWLAMAKWWYNTPYHSSLKLNPFDALYEYPPPKLISYIPGTSANQRVDLTLHTWEQIIQVLKENLKATQNRMKTFADKRRNEREFEEGDWVYLRHQPYQQRSISNR